MPAISIIIPVYKVEKYLRRCLDSVLNQTFADWTAICVNDGSPDGCDKILAEYAARDARFVILTKENGGLSDARNFAMPHATGDYIMYLDSDDFLHPQTMEIAYHLAQRDGSDIVSFTYDRIYRPQLMVRHVLRRDTDNVVPIAMRRKYDVTQIKTRVTDDVYRYATERTHNMFNPRRRWLVKHCQVWKNMYRRNLVADTPFIKGILFEDFPWWSAIMLKNPRVTIAPLPLYFYVPNFGGIVLSERQLKIMDSLCTGLRAAYGDYIARADKYQMKQWSQNFKWYFIKWAYRKTRYISTDTDAAHARAQLAIMRDMGMLDDACGGWRARLRDRILKFIAGQK